MWTRFCAHGHRVQYSVIIKNFGKLTLKNCELKNEMNEVAAAVTTASSVCMGKFTRLVCIAARRQLGGRPVNLLTC